MSPDQTLGRLLLGLALAVAVGRLLAIVFVRLRQPPVLAQIMAGVLLGPSLVGAIPGATDTLFPGPVQQALGAIGGLGLVLFMFIVGVELDLSTVRKHKARTTAISLGAVGLPFALGLGAATVLYDNHHRVADVEVGRLPFSLFVATALSITAFPVLAGIIRDRHLQNSPPAQLAIASAAVQDTVGWLLLAAAIATMSANGSTDLLRIFGEAVALVLVLLLVVRPVLRRYCDTAIVLIGLVACAGATQLIGLHSAIGAFVFGALIPSNRRQGVIERFEQSITPLTMYVLLPVYFLGPGLHLNLRTIDVGGLTELALIMACACGGKLIGAAVPAKLAGASWQDTKLMAVLLNTRGLIELVVLEIGRQKGILDQTLFSIFMTMALATTLMTGPLVHRLQRTRHIPASRQAVAYSK